MLAATDASSSTQPHIEGCEENVTKYCQFWRTLSMRGYITMGNPPLGTIGTRTLSITADRIPCMNTSCGIAGLVMCSSASQSFEASPQHQRPPGIGGLVASDCEQHMLRKSKAPFEAGQQVTCVLR